MLALLVRLGVPEHPLLLTFTSFMSSLVSLKKVRKNGMLGEADGDEVAGRGLAVEESSNTSAESDLGSRDLRLP